MYIVIGASSFIGVYTVNELLKQGINVTVTGRNNRFKDYYESLGVAYYNLSLDRPEDFDRLPDEEIEGVILLAGLLPANAFSDLTLTDNAAEYIRINTLGTAYALEYCRKNGIKRLISTVSYADVKGAWSRGNAITEDEPRNFSYTGDHAAYVISKNAASDLMKYYNEQHGMSNVCFRLPPVYGVGPHGSLLVNGKRVVSGLQIFIDNASAGKTINVYGDEYISRDVVYVKDVAHAFYLAAISDKACGLYNISAGHGTTLKEQAEVIAQIFARDDEHISQINYCPEINNNSSSFLLSIDKAAKDFGYIPEFPRFKDMMTDYRCELDRKVYSQLFWEGM